MKRLDIVIKKAGLAEGKGVLIKPTVAEAEEFIDLVLNGFPFWNRSPKNIDLWLRKRYPELHRRGIF